MEQSRLVIAIALSFLVFLVWGHFFGDKKAPQEVVQEQKTSQADREAPYVKESLSAVTPHAPVLKEVPAQPARSVRMININAPLYNVNISEKGAVFKSYVLKDYRETVDVDSPLKELVPEEIYTGTILMGLKNKSLPDFNNVVFSASAPSSNIEILNEPREVSFSWTSPQGIVIEKKYLFSPETYKIGLVVTIKNGSNSSFRDQLFLSVMSVVPEKAGRYGFSGPSALINDKLEQVKIKDIKKKNIYAGNLKWIAVQDRYFLSGIIPKSPSEAVMHLSLNKGNLLEAQYVQPESEVSSGSQQSFEYLLFLGPKSMKVLRDFDYDLDKVVNFGWFDFIAKPCVWLMNFLYGIIPNFGVAIIILTIMIKLLLWPLGSKSYKSMNAMKKLQPLMTEIREKYKNDKKEMNAQMMNLYKVYKINPMGGCLPMVAQIPVFFALYRMLYEAIELRHAPFFGWINDLSAPDRLFNFDFTVPLMEPPYGIPVLTIVMGASMLLQQKMTPAAGDPMQQKMMMLMPVVFTFIFINFSSGLVLYWLTNNLLSMGQQYYIMKKSA